MGESCRIDRRPIPRSLHAEKGPLSGIRRHKTDPSVDEETAKRRIVGDDPIDPLPPCLHNDKKTQRFVVKAIPIHQGLGGQTWKKIALVAPHDADRPRHIVINLVAPSITLGIEEGEIVLGIDPLPHHKWAGQDGLKEPAVGIANGIVGMEEGPARKISRPQKLLVADNKPGVPGKPPFGADFGRIAGPPEDGPGRFPRA